jgi:hypothetical protein
MYRKVLAYPRVEKKTKKGTSKPNPRTLMSELVNADADRARESIAIPIPVEPLKKNRLKVKPVRTNSDPKDMFSDRPIATAISNLEKMRR